VPAPLFLGRLFYFLNWSEKSETRAFANLVSCKQLSFSFLSGTDFLKKNLLGWGRCHRPGEKVGKNGWIACVFLTELFKSGLDRRCVRVGGKDRPTGIAPWGLGTTAGRDLLAGPWVIKQSDFY